MTTTERDRADMSDVLDLPDAALEAHLKVLRTCVSNVSEYPPDGRMYVYYEPTHWAKP